MKDRKRNPNKIKIINKYEIKTETQKLKLT